MMDKVQKPLILKQNLAQDIRISPAQIQTEKFLLENVMLR
jgi:hypothetical protein